MARILIADDNLMALNMLRAMLPAGEYEIMSVSNGEDAVRLAVEAKPDLLIAATILPLLNGYQICRRLKSQSETARIPVILLTSHSREGDQSRRVEQGVDGYLTRPFSSEQLLDLIGRFTP